MKLWIMSICLLCSTLAVAADNSVHVLVRDISSVEGVRNNPLVGYGLVVGLNGTGDRQQTQFTIQSLTNVLRRMGVQIAPNAVRVNNVAAVFVTASLPPFARSGTLLDVTVSSVGDAKSIEGGLLLMTELRGPDGQVYATAQGSIAVGGYVAGNTANSRTVNQPTVGRIAAGGIVEREAPTALGRAPVALILAEQDFSTAEAVAAAINTELNAAVAKVSDARRIELATDRIPAQNLPALLAQIELLPVAIRPKAKVVVNERTGTIVIGKDVKLGAASILQGNLTVQISTEFNVSQPEGLSHGKTAVVGQQTVNAQETKARRVDLAEGANVQDLVGGLQSIGASTRDVISILQALKAAGALQAELEIL